MPETDATYVFNVDAAYFESDILIASRTTPILVDFWASWCAPCKALGPILEKLAAEYKGAFYLAKVDMDKNQSLGNVLGIRSIPTVMLVKDGQIVDSFAGALPEGQCRAFLSRHITAPATGTTENDHTNAISPVDKTPAQSIEDLQQAITADPGRAELKLDLALALMQSGRNDEAETYYQGLPAELADDARAIRLGNQLALCHTLKQAPSQAELQQRIERNCADWEARDLLGIYLLMNNQPAAGLEQFLHILEKAHDWNDNAAKKRLLAAFNILDDAELVAHSRRRMASLLF